MQTLTFMSFPLVRVVLFDFLSSRLTLISDLNQQGNRPELWTSKELEQYENDRPRNEMLDKNALEMNIHHSSNDAQMGISPAYWLSASQQGVSTHNIQHQSGASQQEREEPGQRKTRVVPLKSSTFRNRSSSPCLYEGRRRAYSSQCIVCTLRVLDPLCIHLMTLPHLSSSSDYLTFR